MKKALITGITGQDGYQGSIKRDTSKPNGTMRKVLDVSQIN